MRLRFLSLPVIMVIMVLGMGCSVHKDWSPTGGSRADAIVKLSYEYGGLEIPNTNEQQGLSLATERCRSWGYSAAQPFGGVTKQCTNMYGGSCNSWFVTKEYQCLGQGTEVGGKDALSAGAEK